MVSRREILYSVGFGVFAPLTGCLGIFSNSAPVEINVINNRQEIEVVRVVISELDGAEQINTQFEVRPTTAGDREQPFVPSTTIREQFAVGEEYRFEADVEGGKSTTTRVSADCSGDEGGQQWAARLTSDGAIQIHDDDC